MKRIVIKGNRNLQESAAQDLSIESVNIIDNEIRKFINSGIKRGHIARTVDYDELVATIWIKITNMINKQNWSDETVTSSIGGIWTAANQATLDYIKSQNTMKAQLANTAISMGASSETGDTSYEEAQMTGRGSQGKGKGISVEARIQIEDMLKVIAKEFTKYSPEYRYFIGQLALSNMLDYFKNSIPRDQYEVARNIESRKQHAEFTYIDSDATTDKSAFKRTIPKRLQDALRKYGYTL